VVIKKFWGRRRRHSEEDKRDLKLVRAAAGGDMAAYRELVERYEGRLYACAFGVVRNPEDARDLVQDALIKAYFSLPRFREESSFFTWIYRIVLHLAIDHRRKVQRRGVDLALADLNEGGSSAGSDQEFAGGGGLGVVEEGPEVLVSRKEEILKLQGALASISEEQRQAFILREVDGLSYQEIGEALGVSVGTVMSRLFYARKRLRELMESEATDMAKPMPGRSRWSA